MRKSNRQKALVCRFRFKSVQRQPRGNCSPIVQSASHQKEKKKKKKKKTRGKKNKRASPAFSKQAGLLGLS